MGRDCQGSRLIEERSNDGIELRIETFDASGRCFNEITGLNLSLLDEFCLGCCVKRCKFVSKGLLLDACHLYLLSVFTRPLSVSEPGLLVLSLPVGGCLRQFALASARSRASVRNALRRRWERMPAHRPD